MKKKKIKKTLRLWGRTLIIVGGIFVFTAIVRTDGYPIIGKLEIGLLVAGFTSLITGIIFRAIEQKK